MLIFNVNESSKVLNLIREVCSTKISPNNWEHFVSYVIKEEISLEKLVLYLTGHWSLATQNTSDSLYSILTYQIKFPPPHAS